jgi:cell division protein FtsI (penicillin-binding protein 3)
MMRAQTRVFPWRFRVLLLVFVLCIGVCIHKTMRLNMEQGDFLRQEGDKRSIKPSVIAAYRGSIVDRKWRAVGGEYAGDQHLVKPKRNCQ